MYVISIVTVTRPMSVYGSFKVEIERRSDEDPITCAWHMVGE